MEHGRAHPAAGRNAKLRKDYDKKKEIRGRWNKNGLVPKKGTWRWHLANFGWNKVIYDQIKGIEKGEETTAFQKPLKLGRTARRTVRLKKKFRSFRVRVSRIRVRVSPMLWFKKFLAAYVQMMVTVQDQLGNGGGLVMGFHTTYPARSPYAV
ncbi:hypothetical protein R1sor_026859 [Riccia sorocarpa]|uniref:Uncharacterized protein n=1 Tax=Riccia sorocarpa TaxID=122646 RepID=A0ABD3GE42_9MARC